jgi:hypothetical protein
MNSFGSKTSRNKQNKGSNNRSLARAMAETEKRRDSAVSGTRDLQNEHNKHNLLPNQPTEIDPAQTGQQLDPEQIKREQEAKLKKEQLREKLHNKVNPVEQTDIFDQRKKEEKRQIEQIRQELEKLSDEIADFYKEVDITLQKRTPDPGLEGTYYKNFFEKLKAFIILLRQKVRSAKTWARQMRQKKKKQKRKRGLNFSANEAKATHDMLHHERYNAYSGA